jgi:indole-3-glycerol phosphate synthase
MNKLTEIFQNKAEEVERAKAAISLAELKSMVADAPPVRPFKRALEQSGKSLALIAEVKKASPSKGIIRQDFDPVYVATAYREAGADCLSVLTDQKYFQGSKENLALARTASGLPCLRKDFIADPYQVYEARAWGSDCILLIVAGFADQGLLCELWSIGKELGMDVLVEVHSLSEAETALDIKADFIGVNNRNLSDMTTDIATSEVLLPIVSPYAYAVSESALESRADLDRVQAAGARAVLIGSSFCSSPDICRRVQEVMGW